MSSSQSWSRRLLSYPVVLAAALMVTLLLFTTRMYTNNAIITDPDVWWHLSNARALVTTGHFIRQDTVTFTVTGKPWINFEWLAELPYFYAYRWMGDRGLFLVMMLAAGGIVLGVYRLAILRSDDVKAAFLASWVAVLLTTVSLAPRTLLFGWLLLIAELGLLWTFRKNAKRSWLLPPLFLVWINTHGSWFIGFVLMLVFAAAGFIGGRWGDIESEAWTPQQRRTWFGVIAASFALLFINPYGWRLVAYPLDVAFSQALTLKYIAEWATLDFHAARGKIVLATIMALALLNLLRRRTWQLSDVLFTLIAIYGAVTYTRFVFLAGILIAPLLAIDLRGVLGSYDAEADRPGVNAVALAVLAAVFLLMNPSRAMLHQGLSDTYPEQAQPRLAQLPPETRLLNYFEWGGYLMWAAPQRPLFIDGRTDIFVHEGVMQDYADALTGARAFDVLDKYRIDAVLFPRQGTFYDLLVHSPAWKLTYQDRNAALFERVTAASR